MGYQLEPVGRKETRLELANAHDALRCTSAQSTLLLVCCVQLALDRESCIDKSSPTFARPAYTGAVVASRFSTDVLVTYRYPHGTRRATRASCEPRLRDRLDTADGNLSEKSAINADARGPARENT